MGRVGAGHRGRAVRARDRLEPVVRGRHRQLADCASAAERGKLLGFNDLLAGLTGAGAGAAGRRRAVGDRRRRAGDRRRDAGGPARAVDPACAGRLHRRSRSERIDASCPGARRPTGAGTESDAASCRGSELGHGKDASATSRSFPPGPNPIWRSGHAPREAAPQAPPMRCAAVNERLYEQDPDLRGRHRRIEDECQNLISKGYAQRVRRKLITIQVVVHVVPRPTRRTSPTSRSQSQIEVLNKDYRGTNADAAGPGPVDEPRRRPEHPVRARHQGPRRQGDDGITRTQTDARLVRHRRRRQVGGRRRRRRRGRPTATSTSGSATSAAACSATRSSPAGRPRPTAS